VNRATIQYHPQRAEVDAPLAARLAALAVRHPRYGYRRVWALLRRDGLAVNRKRVQRLWRHARLQVGKPSRRPRRAPGLPGRAADTPPTRATHPNQVWTYDFVHDACLNGTKFKVLPVVDEFTRECLGMAVATTMPAARVLDVLAHLVATYGAPEYLRSDNGPEFIAHSVQDWLARHHAQTLYIAPGCPWQNGFAESFNATLRDECLNRFAFLSVAEAYGQIEAFRRQYNEERPHSRLGYRTPAAFKADWLADQSHPPHTARS
jgi:putative transposase